jgi:hypothetical protein
MLLSGVAVFKPLRTWLQKVDWVKTLEKTGLQSEILIFFTAPGSGNLFGPSLRPGTGGEFYNSDATDG